MYCTGKVSTRVLAQMSTNRIRHLSDSSECNEGMPSIFSLVFIFELPAGAVAPFSLTPIPNANAFFAADAGIGADVLDFSQGSGALGPNSQSFPIPDQGAVCWSAYSPATGSYYVSDSE